MSELLDGDELRRLERLALSRFRAAAAGAAGERPGPARGPALDFADHRPYAPGDEVRRIDWNAWARLRRLVVKVGDEQGRPELGLLLDTSRSMELGTPPKLRHAQRLAAVAGAVALLEGGGVAAAACADGAAHPLARLEGPRQLARFLDELEAVPRGGRTGLAAAVGAWAAAGRRTDLTLLLTDAHVPGDDLDDALAAAGRAAASVVLVHVVAPDELATGLRGSVELVDAETGERLDLVVDEGAAAAYARRQERFLAAVEAVARRAGATYVRAVAGDDPLAALAAPGAPLSVP